MATPPRPTEIQIATLRSLPADSPVAALNLFQFRDKAQYQPGDPEFDTAAANVTGREAYAKYAEVAGKTLATLGGKVAFSTPVDQIMIGPSEPEWDVAAIMYFPTRKAFMQMLSDTEFQAASKHSQAALANHNMLHLAGNPFKNQVD